MSSPNTTGQFVLQIVGVTDGKVLSRPSQKHIMCEGLADVHINKKNIDVLAYSPSLGCDGLVESDMDVLVAPCPPDEEDIDVLVSMGKSIEPFTHSVFLSIFREENDIVEQKPVKSTLFNKIAPIPIVNEEEEEEKNVLPERDVIVVPASEPKPVEKVKAKRGRKKKGQDEAAPVENIVITPTSTSTITPSKIIELKQDGDSDDEEDETENEQCIAVNPKIAIELMESVIEKNLMKKLLPVTRFKRNIHIFLEGKVDSVFSFVGFCDDGIPFNMEVNNVPCAEYDHGERPDEIMTGDSPIYSHQPNGLVERTISKVQGQVRAMKSALQSRIKGRVNNSWDIVPWLVRHVAATICRFNVGEDGETPHSRVRGGKFRGD